SRRRARQVLHTFPTRRSSDLDQPPPDASFHVVPLAWQTVVVLAPATVQLNQISFAQLAGVFGAGEGSDWKRWGDLGVTGEMAPRDRKSTRLNSSHVKSSYAVF